MSRTSIVIKIVMSQVVLSFLWKAELYVVYSMPYSSYHCFLKYLDTVRYGKICVYWSNCVSFYGMAVSVY